NPLSGVGGSWDLFLDRIEAAVAVSPATGWGEIIQRDAASRIQEVPAPILCTDPPYYDNIGYADLSDFFYVWICESLRPIWPDEFATVLTQKTEELIATPFRL